MGANIRDDVTIVISVKDTYFIAEQQLRAVLDAAPGIPVIYVLSGPISPGVKQSLLSLQNDHPQLEFMDTGITFGNPYHLRNLAVPRISTKYTLFIFNDVFPHGERWLSALYALAEEKPEVAIFQPFILEGNEAPHAAWNGITFYKVGNNYFTMHTYDHARKDIQDPAETLAASEQPWFLEDHAFFARTDFLKSAHFIDTGACYTQEFLDMALSAKSHNAPIWSVPAAQVKYETPYTLGQDDVLMFVYRRSEEICLGSVIYIRKKWGIQFWPNKSYRIWKHFTDEQLVNSRWGPEQLPNAVAKQVELLIAMLTAIGFNRFALSYQDVDRTVHIPAGSIPEIYPALRVLAERDHPGPVAVSASLVQHIPEYTLPEEDPVKRYSQLKSGNMFPIVDGTAGEFDIRDYKLAYEPFFVLECFELRLSPAEARIQLKGIPALILEKSIDNQLSEFKVYLHGRLINEQSDLIEKLVRKLKQSQDRMGGLSIGGYFFPGAVIRVIHGMKDEMPAITVGRDASDWKVFNWSWQRFDHGRLLTLFNMQSRRAKIKQVLPRLYSLFR